MDSTCLEPGALPGTHMDQPLYSSQRPGELDAPAIPILQPRKLSLGEDRHWPEATQSGKSWGLTPGAWLPCLCSYPPNNILVAPVSTCRGRPCSLSQKGHVLIFLLL